MSRDMRVRETRRLQSGITRRTYVGPDGRAELVTYEMPATVAKGLGLGKIEEAMARFARGKTMRERAAEVRRLVGENPQMTDADLAAKIGVTRQRVSQVRQDLAKGRPAAAKGRMERAAEVRRMVAENPHMPDADLADWAMVSKKRIRQIRREMEHRAGGELSSVWRASAAG